ncbi:MAG: hypothetical protein IPM97_03895 [Bdellovibrionaceae bacterium]|nr:hypothetical protein [Pseudobdellovibrionaceae bacterium]
MRARRQLYVRLQAWNWLPKKQSIEDLSASDQIRVLAVAASALVSKRVPKRPTSFSRSAGKSSGWNSKEDPANRALAVAGNNLACSLEEKLIGLR